jgi:two-component system, OmpR family, response regulator CpxR
VPEAAMRSARAASKRRDRVAGRGFAFRCRHRHAACTSAEKRGAGFAARGRDEHKYEKRGKEKKSKVMRPKKIILCVNGNEQELSVLKFMLSTNGYKVVSAATGNEAIGAFGAMQIDLVLADINVPQMNGDQLVQRLKKIAAHVPMILLGDPQAANGEIHVADAMLHKKNCSSMELLERIKVMSARKRGPRKGALRAAQASALAAAS